jgi:type IV pilus assembly protein PilQ
MSTARAINLFPARSASRRACAATVGIERRSFAAALLALVAALVALLAAPARAQAPALQLQDMQVQSLPGNRIELELKLSGPAPAPLSFTIENPARISVDLANTSIALPARRREVGAGPLSTILAAESGGRTRVVLNLDTMVPYETRVSGNSVFVTLGTAGSTSTFAAAPAAQAPAPVATAAAPASATPAAGRSIRGVDFRRGKNGGGRIVVDLSDAGTAVDVRKEAGQIVLVFAGTQVPDNLLKRYDVTDFATPVDSVSVMRAGGDARVMVAAHGAYEELAYQTDQVFTVELQPVVKAAAEEKATLFGPGKEYSGERLTLNFQDIETRAVLQLLADVSGRNIVVSDTVQGNVTLRLQNVPWDQALDIVLATKGLDKRQNGNVMIIAPAEEIAAREKSDLAARKEIRELEPLVSEFLQVNYAKASDLAELIKGKSKNSLLSERGSIALDDRTNTLLVQDTADRIADIRRLVATLDIPVRQVLIESRIVVVRDDFSRDLGVRWGVTAVDDRSDGLIAVTGNATGTDTIVNSGIDNINNNGTPFPVEVPALDDRFNVNLPVASPAGRLAVALLDEDFLVDLELSALQAEGRGEVISSPRVITANQKEASIRQGVEIPYQESSSSGATTTQFKEAVLSLTVTPQITPDDRIIMDLKVTKDSVGEVITNERGGQVPSIDTRSVVTQVLVDNGQTVVLGGVYETEQGEDFRKVPFLGDIPLVGYLFRSTKRVSNKSELLIFVTPKILKEGSSIY